MEEMGFELWLARWVELSGRVMDRVQQKLNWQGKLLLYARHLEGLEWQPDEVRHHYKGNKKLVILDPP